MTQQGMTDNLMGSAEALLENGPADVASRRLGAALRRCREIEVGRSVMKRQTHVMDGSKRLERLFMRTFQDTAHEGGVASREARVSAIEADIGVRALVKLATEALSRGVSINEARDALRKWRTGR